MRKKLIGEWHEFCWVRPAYFQRYPNSERALWWQQQLFVYIRTENGFWRPDAKGYVIDVKDSGIGTYTFTEAMRYVKDLGPEKHARIWAYK